jgi:hypothetical protein
MLGLLGLLYAPSARAEGEYGPMFGGSLVATRGADQTEVAGAELEMAMWRGRFGIAVAASRQAGIDGTGPTVTAVDASVRVLLLRHLMPSLLEPRDVELGIEVQGIVERAWWDHVEREHAPVSYGLGFAVRLRGGSDDFSNLIAESRLFVRAMASQGNGADTLARDTMVPGDTGRELTIVVGLGALFGGGERGYVERFRPRPLDTTLLPPM